MKLLSDKTLLITGGTSRLGREIVRKALAEGAKVFLTTFQNQKEADALREAGAEVFQIDLSSMDQIDTLAAELKEKIQHLDILIHNAALVKDHTLQNLSEEDWDSVMTVNLKAPYYLTKKLMPLLFQKKNKKNSAASPQEEPTASDSGKTVASKIFFITSRAAIAGGFGISNYAAAKAGLIGLTKSLAQELGKRQILVNAVNPGFMKSSMTENLPEAVLRHHLELSPVSKYSNPAEVADFLVYLSSAHMAQVTGQVFHFESRKL